MPKVRGDVLKRLRDAKGWSQEALADKAIVSLKTISSLEKEGSTARPTTISKVAKALGIAPAELVDQGDPEVPSVAPVILPADRRVNVTLTLSIPFESFDETEGLDRLTALLASLVKAKNAIGVAEVTAGSVNVTFEVDPEDAASITRAFTEGALESIQAGRLTLSQEFALSLVVGQALAGFLSSLGGLFMSIASLPFATLKLRQSGVKTVLNEDGSLVLLRPGESAPEVTVTSTPVYSEAVLRRAIGIATPDGFLPDFPCTFTIQLEPRDGNGQTAVQLGMQLEQALANLTAPKPSVSRTDDQQQWSGKLAVLLATPDELRATAYALMKICIGQNITLTVQRESSASSLAGQLDTSIQYKVHLSDNLLTLMQAMISRLLAH